MSKKNKVVKLSSRTRTKGKEALVTYAGETMTRAEREAKIRAQIKPQEEGKTAVSVKKGTKVAEARPQNVTAKTAPKAVEKKETTGNEWYVKVLRFLCDLFSFTVAQKEKSDAEDDEIDQWSLVADLFIGLLKTKSSDPDELDEKTATVKYKNLPKGPLLKSAKDSALGADNRFNECQAYVEELNKVLADIAQAKTPKDASDDVKAQCSEKRAVLRKKRDEIEAKLYVADSNGRTLERTADVYAYLLEIVSEEKPIDFRTTGRFEPKSLKLSKSEIESLISKFNLN